MPQLTLSVASSSSNQDLTALALTDWMAVHNPLPILDFKSGGGGTIGASRYGGGSDSATGTLARTISWTDGTNFGTGSISDGVLNSGGANTGYEITFPATTAVRQAKIYLGGFSSTVKVTAIISDASTGNQIDTTLTGVASTFVLGVATVIYQASGTATLTVRVEAQSGLSSPGVVVQGAAWGAYTAPAGPVITGPSGAAGAASSTANLAEVATTGPTFNTSVALGVGYPTLTGADAALFTLTALTSTSWRVDPVAPFNFESLPHANPFNVTFNASASVNQTCAISITNVNEAPTFSGTISVPTLTVGVAMSSINAAALFSDPDSGDTGTYSAVGSWPAGVTVSSGGLISGTPTTNGTYSSLRVRRTDGGGLTADSNLFSIQVDAAGAAPAVSSQPSNQSVVEGATATFSAGFSNSPTGFAWEYADSPYTTWAPVVGGSGAATATYSITTTLAMTGRRFRCTASNAFGSVTTNGAAQLTVTAAPVAAGFDLDTAAGCVIGNVSGSLVGLGREAAGRGIVVHAKTAGTDTTVCSSGTLTTNSNGRLPRWTHASLVLGTQYDLYFVPVDGGKPGVRRMAAT